MLRDAICSIPAGETWLTVRAHNPLPIVASCHRIVASNGLGHYSGGQGLVTKRRLLAHESKEKMLWEP